LKFNSVTHTAIVALSALGVAGQVLVAAGLLAGLAALVGVRAPLQTVRRALWGYELWAAFAIAAIATGGSLFFSEIAHFVPCELCWFERICLFPLSIITLLAALAADFRVARYLLPLPLAGVGISIYHLLIERGVVGQSTVCLASAPGGCATKWIDEFGYVTIPVIALTGFLLLLGVLGVAAVGGGNAHA
jgi:disulfide bond formation protein DsbB